MSLSLLDFRDFDNGGAHPLVMDALAEMSEAQIHRAYLSVCEYAHALPTRARTKGTPLKTKNYFFLTNESSAKT